MRASTGGRIAVTDFVRNMSQNPAKTFGLYPQKGTLRPGSDADMVLVAPGWPR
ncbi:amidohydrolase family protein, partial [Bilophila wadsworthia]